MLSVLFPYLYQFLECTSFFIIASFGMAIIYGMMNITDLAHGEFIMLGAYTTVLLVNKLNFPFALAVLGGTIFSGIIGLLMDRLIMCRLYGRTMDSIVVSWGVSIVLSQVVYIIFNASITGIEAPFGSVTILGKSYAVYRFVLMLIALLLVIALYLLFSKTKFGLHARATMQLREVAGSMGVNTNRINAATFAFGSALAGFAGGLYAPISAITPTLGQNFQTQSFVAVVVGGTNPIIGTILASGGLGVVESILTVLYGSFAGRMGILAVAILFIRVLPTGFTGLYEKYITKREG